MILFFLLHPYHYRSQQRAQKTSESFLAFVFCSSVIGIGEANNPHRRVMKSKSFNNFYWITSFITN
jgi:hypothetical protein